MRKEKIILGIETSCDDTSICILKNGTNFPEILSHKSFTQEQMLSKWGGIVPEIAARNHLEKLAPLLKDCMNEAAIKGCDIGLIGVTASPGLLGPLLTGINVAKTLAMRYQIPVIPVNHLFAHLEAIHLTEKISYPYLGLLVSGGHSIYFLVENREKFTLLGSTIDDASGEAFDKGGKLLGLGYPAGRIIDERGKLGDSSTFNFPIGMQHSKDCRLSFSGLKSSMRLYIEKNGLPTEDKIINDICASYQKAIVSALSIKLKFAHKKASEILQSSDPLPTVVGGGVACNSALRTIIHNEFKDTHFVAPKYCTDNGAMIANYALRNQSQAIPYPECLTIDARGRYVDKKKQKQQPEKI